MKLLLTAGIIFMAFCASAQDSTRILTFTKVEVEPEYPGGQKAWVHFLNKTLRYPADAISNEIQGVVVVQFIVDSAGNTSDFQAISGPTIGHLREEAVRVVTASGHWIPGTQNGYKVRCYYKVPIVFKLVSR